MTNYKFLRLKNGQIVSDNGDTTWIIGEWQTVKGKLELCQNGLHCSKRAIDALMYVYGEVIAKIETAGRGLKDGDKSAHSKMRIIEAKKWQKKDSVALSIYAAELCIANYEKVFPGDDRPRKAIEAAKLVLEKDTARNRTKAESAAWSAESAAWSAESAARSAAWSAESAAWSAESAAWSARSAAWSAESAARSAESAAWSAESAESAAWSAAKEKALDDINDWMIKRYEELEEL